MYFCVTAESVIAIGKKEIDLFAFSGYVFLFAAALLGNSVHGLRAAARIPDSDRKTAGPPASQRGPHPTLS